MCIRDSSKMFSPSTLFGSPSVRLDMNGVPISGALPDAAGRPFFSPNTIVEKRQRGSEGSNGHSSGRSSIESLGKDTMSEFLAPGDSKASEADQIFGMHHDKQPKYRVSPALLPSNPPLFGPESNEIDGMLCAASPMRDIGLPPRPAGRQLSTPTRHPTHLLSLIHISEPTRLLSISYAVFCLKKKKK
eukprot:TRINITY_DN21085_c0_g2_i2.p2 TRINITY_DN21085_c0_g2~~TRINITY_DN21085_c0_g2_i2.p2  ORF type:complete len:188 (+),score=59.06 TRINITY_DN21085_c0_g2_i2:98-661(+)